MYTFNRNNRECIHRLKSDAEFIDFTDSEYYYLVNDELNLSHIKEDDMVKFELYDIRTDSKQRIYGFVKYITNVSHTTFMVLQHFDELGNIFYLDYKYCSYLHAFLRLNEHGSFSDWNQLTHIKGAHAPHAFVNYWLENHVTTEATTESPYYELSNSDNYNNEQVQTSIPPKEYDNYQRTKQLILDAEPTTRPLPERDWRLRKSVYETGGGHIYFK